MDTGAPYSGRAIKTAEDRLSQYEQSFDTSWRFRLRSSVEMSKKEGNASIPYRNRGRRGRDCSEADCPKWFNRRRTDIPSCKEHRLADILCNHNKRLGSGVAAGEVGCIVDFRHTSSDLSDEPVLWLVHS